MQAAGLQTLNDAQRAAADFGRGDPAAPALLVIAGAGTGKTMALAHRVAHLVIRAIGPARILLLTFTRRAAQTMTRRVEAIVRKALHDSMAAMHRWCNFPGRALFTRLPTGCCVTTPSISVSIRISVLDRGDSADLMDLLRHEHGLSTQRRRFPRKETCLAIYSHRVNSGRTLEDVLSQGFPWCEEWLQELTGTVPRLHGAQAVPRRPRLRRPAALLARADAGAASSRQPSAAASTTCWSTNTRTSTGCRPTSCSR